MRKNIEMIRKIVVWVRFTLPLGSKIAVKRMFRDDKALSDWKTEVRVLRFFFPP